MGEYAKIETRLAEALRRASKAAERLDGPDEAALASLQAELAAEREAASRLEARIREMTAEADAAKAARKELEAARASAEEETATVRAESERLEASLTEQSMLLERLQKTSAELTGAMKVLREAQTADLVDAHLIDRAMKKELDALHAARESERAEMEAIVAALAPLMEETQNA
jgi:chromosome segregation ATPase